MGRTLVMPCAGLGSRLGEFTKNYSKAMCTLGVRPIFSYILGRWWNPDDEIIILLGYKGDLLKQAIQAYYPDWNIKFVNVDKYEGEGSGLGYSLSCARELLQKPFWFWSCDTILYDENEFPISHGATSYKLPDCQENTIFVSDQPVSGTNLDYRCAMIQSADDGDNSCKMVRLLPKESTEYRYPYIGVSFIKNYEAFWKAADDNFDAFVASGESWCLNALKDVFIQEIKHKTWIDTGNRAVFENAKKMFAESTEFNILEKPDEAIWINDCGNVIKFHVDTDFIAKRVERAKNMLNEKQKKAGIRVPEVVAHSANTYTYKWTPGSVMSTNLNKNIFVKLLDSFISNAELVEVDDKYKQDFYKKFYYEKTIKRIKKFMEQTGEPDEEVIINGLVCPPVLPFLERIELSVIHNVSKFAKMSRNVHGDFHLENIIYDKEKDTFTLLDWRQGFDGDDYNIGDINYDLAKMMHSLIVNHEMVKNNLFKVKSSRENGVLSVEIDIHNTFIESKCLEKLKKWIVDEYGKDEAIRVEFFTALIFLNICACHTYPYSKFLFYLGRYLLQENVIRSKYGE